MDSPRTTLSLGPLEISIRRGDEGPRFGLPGSIGVHILAIVLAMLLSTHEKKVVKAAEAAAAAAEKPIPITFVNPLPPVKPPKQEPFDIRKPPPAQAKPLRMEPVPESIAELRNAPKDAAKRDSGRRDTRPAGGEQGGPLPKPAPGAPPQGSQRASPDPTDRTASSFNEPKDLMGRLREFRRAVEAPQTSEAKGERGGGKGRGGVTMPDLPATGFGVGNLEFEGRDYDWEDYGRQIHGIIWRAWHNRLLITSAVFERWATEHRTWLLDHRNAVRFTILKSGQVVDVALEASSGCYPLDDSSTDALKEVVLPPLPDDFPRESETVHARFIADGDIRGMRTYLQYLKNAGVF